MNENQTQLETTISQIAEPTDVDNSQNVQFVAEEVSSEQKIEEGQSCLNTEQDHSEEMILGKFKTVEELTKAYSELQKLQGQNSQELGQLRQEANSNNELKESLANVLAMRDGFVDTINTVKEKYNKPEYFQNSSFRDLYKEAFMALGGNIDSDKFINLLESYVKSRVNIYEKNKSANAETQEVLDAMTYSENPKNNLTPPKKSLDEMTSQEIDDLIEMLI